MSKRGRNKEKKRRKDRKKEEEGHLHERPVPFGSHCFAHAAVQTPQLLHDGVGMLLLVLQGQEAAGGRTGSSRRKDRKQQEEGQEAAGGRTGSIRMNKRQQQEGEEAVFCWSCSVAPGGGACMRHATEVSTEKFRVSMLIVLGS